MSLAISLVQDVLLHSFSYNFTNYEPVVPEFSTKNIESPEKETVSSLAYKSFITYFSTLAFIISSVDS